MDFACSVVQSIESKTCSSVGPLLPKLRSNLKSGDTSTEEEKTKKDSAPAAEKRETPPAADPPEEE